MSEALKPGDLVQPVSGGQVMMVTRILDERVEVKWSANCRIQVKAFDADVLRKVVVEHPAGKPPVS
jgi:preprotein translocase subunit YajC